MLAICCPFGSKSALCVAPITRLHQYEPILYGNVPSDLTFNLDSDEPPHAEPF